MLNVSTLHSCLTAKWGVPWLIPPPAAIESTRCTQQVLGEAERLARANENLVAEIKSIFDRWPGFGDVCL
jgi:hypothetical protein